MGNAPSENSRTSTVRHVGLTAAAAILACLATTAGAAAADLTGVWTVAMEGAPRQCRVQLRADPAGTGQAVSIPPGCHRALPVLNLVRNWTTADGTQVVMNDEAGQAVLIFEDRGDALLHAAGGDGTSYTLAPVGTARAQIRTVEAVAAPPVPAPADVPVQPSVPPRTAPVLPQTSVASVAGHYAVMRGERDTGCMVTLDPQVKGPKSTLKARLAPACRDQGIIVFDPVGWELKAGRIVLTARKGHTTDLDRNETGEWIKDTKTGQPLGLKRL